MMKKLKANSQFTSILESEEIKIQISTVNLRKLMFPNFISIYDCIIINDNPISISLDKFNDVVYNMYTNKTGYEASNTETLINFWIDEENLPLFELVKLALISIDVWWLSLKQIDSESKFCFIISCDVESNFVTLRVHKIRDNEDMWLTDNLEEYNQPIAYTIY